MMLKVNSEYLDFNNDIDIERKVKLFEEIDSVDGDFSYQFEIYLSSHNFRVLGFPTPDNVSKLVYRKIPTQVLSDSGDLISIGSLRVERVANGIAYCSFFSGNSNWFAMLEGDMSTLDLSDFEVEQTATTIQNSWLETSGIVFPLLDSGVLSTRSYPVTKVEDYTPGIYLKDLFRKTFEACGLKIAGELLQDSLYNQIVVFSNNRSKSQIDARSTFATATGGQSSLTFTPIKIIFNTVSNSPYFDGEQGNYDTSLSRYTADVKMNINLDFVGKGTIVGGSFAVYKNGTVYRGLGVAAASSSSFSGSIKIPLEAGDYVEVWGFYIGSFSFVSLKITPTFLFSVFNDSVVPKWTKQQFVSNVLRLFCAIPSYDFYSKTITINLFDKLKEKDRLDLSEFIQVVDTDYSEFISDYAKVNTFKFTESDDIDLREYNISTFLKYGAGQITSNNEHIQANTTVVDSEFSAPISYKHKSIQASIERLNFTELVENGETDITSVDDDSGVAKLFVDNVNLFELGSLVRIKDSNDSTYNGDWFVIEVGSDYIKCLGLLYSTDANAKVATMIHESTDSEDVFLLVNAPNQLVDDFSPLVDIYLEFTPLSQMSIAFFNMLNLGEPINQKYIQGLSFGNVDDPLSYQRSLIDKYWQSFSRIVNDPVKLKFIAYLPSHVHDQMDFLRPIEIRTLESVNLYYLNLERGYKGSHVSCEGELIKLP